MVRYLSAEDICKFFDKMVSAYGGVEILEL